MYKFIKISLDLYVEEFISNCRDKIQKAVIRSKIRTKVKVN